MKPDTWCRTALAAVVLVIVSGCSVTDYAPAVTKFSEATENAEKALVGLDQQVRDIKAARQRARALAPGAQVLPHEGDCRFESPRCRLDVVDTGPRGLLIPESPIPEVVSIMSDVRSYANNLTTLVNADTAAKASASVNAALANVEKIANTVAKHNKPDAKDVSIPQFATPVGNAAGWIIGQYVARVQVSGLRDATRKADSVIESAGVLFEAVGAAAQDSAKVGPSEDLENRLAVFEQQDQNTEQNLRKLDMAVVTFDQLLRVRAANVFASMREAHGALTRRLENDKLSLASVIAKIESFASEAEQLVKIIEDLRAIGAEKNEET